MASKNINVLLSLVDRFTSPIQKVAASTKQAERQMKSAHNLVSNFGAGANKRFLSLAGGVASFAAKIATLGGLLSVGGLVAYGNACIEAASKQVIAETKLGTILGNVQSIQERGPGAVEKAKAALIDYAGALQKVGVVGDEVTIAGMQQLATFQLNDGQIKQLSAGMLDLLVQQKGLNATQEDAVGVAALIGKALDGNAGALTRAGIKISDAEKNLIKFGDSEQRAALISQILERSVGGVNKSMAQTAEGRAQQAKNAYGDMMEEIGKKLTPFKAKFMGLFANLIPVIQGKILPLIDKIGAKFESLYPIFDNLAAQIGPAFDGLGATISAIADAFTPFFNFLLANGDAVIGILLGVVAGFTAWNIAMELTSALTLLGKAIDGVTIAGSALNFVLTMNPIGLACIAIAALIAILVVLYNRSETARNIINQLWEGIKAGAMMMAPVVSAAINLVTGTVGKLVSGLEKIFSSGSILGAVLSAEFGGIRMAAEFMAMAFSAAINVIVVTVGMLQGILGGIIDFVVGVFTGNWQAAWDGVSAIFSSVFNGLVAIASGPLNVLVGMVNSVIGAINSINFTVPDFVPGIGGSTFAPRVTPISPFATGTDYFGGGPAEVNEGGRGEIINLPNGSQVIPHDKSIQSIASTQKQEINLSLIIQGNLIGNQEFINDCGEQLTRRVKAALANS